MTAAFLEKYTVQAHDLHVYRQDLKYNLNSRGNSQKLERELLNEKEGG